MPRSVCVYAYKCNSKPNSSSFLRICIFVALRLPFHRHAHTIYWWTLLRIHTVFFSSIIYVFLLSISPFARIMCTVRTILYVCVFASSLFSRFLISFVLSLFFIAIFQFIIYSSIDIERNLRFFLPAECECVCCMAQIHLEPIVFYLPFVLGGASECVLSAFIFIIIIVILFGVCFLFCHSQSRFRHDAHRKHTAERRHCLYVCLYTVLQSIHTVRAQSARKIT